MAERMLGYLNEQKSVWRHICENRAEIVSDFTELLMNNKVKRVAMVSSGSSNYAARIAACLLRPMVADVEWITAVPSRLEELGAHFSDTIVFAVSQSGKSTSTHQAIQILQKSGAKVVSVTSDEGSPIAKAGNLHICIKCGEETVGPKTKGTTATVLTLYLLGLEIAKAFGKEPKDWVNDLNTAFSNAQENIQRSLDFANKNASLIAKAPCLTLIADGVGLPVSEEGALKLLETLYIPASAWEFEEYLHGVNNIIGPGIYHIFLLQNNENFKRMNKLIEYCDARGCEVLVINCSGQEIAFKNTVTLFCTGKQDTLAYEALIPYQVLSAVISEVKSIQCDRPRYPDFYAALGTKTDAKTGD